MAKCQKVLFFNMHSYHEKRIRMERDRAVRKIEQDQKVVEHHRREQKSETKRNKTKQNRKMCSMSVGRVLRSKRTHSNSTRHRMLLFHAIFLLYVDQIYEHGGGFRLVGSMFAVFFLLYFYYIWVR